MKQWEEPESTRASKCRSRDWKGEEQEVEGSDADNVSKVILQDKGTRKDWLERAAALRVTSW